MNREHLIKITAKCKSIESIRALEMHNKGSQNNSSISELDSYIRDLLPGKGSDDVYCDIINRITGGNYTSDNVPIFGQDSIYYADRRKLRDGGINSKESTVLAFGLKIYYPGDMVEKEDARCEENLFMQENETGDSTKRKIVIIDPDKYDCDPDIVLSPLNIERIEEWITVSLNFTRDRFGQENLMSAVLHMHGWPHIHMIFAPLVANDSGIERLSYNKIFPGRTELIALQADYADTVTYIGIIRKNGSDKEIKHKDDLNKIDDEVINIPTEYESAINEIKTLRQEKRELQEIIKGLMRSANQIPQMLTTKSDLLDQLKERNTYIEKMESHISWLQQELRKKELENYIREKGMELYPNQEAVDIVKKLNMEFDEEGRKYYNLLGKSDIVE